MQHSTHPTALHRFLAADGELQPVVAKARDIGALARLCRGFLPADLASQVLAVIPKERGLVLLAAHSAAAAKLRLLAGPLGNLLANQGWKVNSVSVRVQPKRAPLEERAAQQKKALSASGLAELARLRDRVGESPFRTALEALLRHHAGGPAETPKPVGPPGRRRRPAHPRRARS